MLPLQKSNRRLCSIRIVRNNMLKTAAQSRFHGRDIVSGHLNQLRHSTGDSRTPRSLTPQHGARRPAEPFVSLLHPEKKLFLTLHRLDLLFGFITTMPQSRQFFGRLIGDKTCLMQFVRTAGQPMLVLLHRLLYLLPLSFQFGKPCPSFIQHYTATVPITAAVFDIAVDNGQLLLFLRQSLLLLFASRLCVLLRSFLKADPLCQLTCFFPFPCQQSFGLRQIVLLLIFLLRQL